MKHPTTSSSTIDILIDLVSYLRDIEKNSNQYLVKQNFCLSMIPPGIFRDMLEDAGYFGLNKDHKSIDTLTSMHTERFNNYYFGNNERYCLFTRKGLADFVETGEISDHLHLLRPFKENEIKKMLEFTLEQLKNNSNFHMMLLNDDYYLRNICYSYNENSMLYLFDNIAGYGPDAEEAIITAPPILNVFDDFIKNELMANHTLDKSESIAFITSLI